MKEIKLTVEGKDYIKNKFTGEDWLRMLDYIEAAGEAPITKQFFDARYDAVSDMMKIPRDKLIKADLEEVTAAFKALEEGLTSAFFGIQASRTVASTPETPDKAS